MQTIVPFAQVNAPDKSSTNASTQTKQSLTSQDVLKFLGVPDISAYSEKERTEKGKADEKKSKPTFIDSVREGKTTLRIGASHSGVKEVQEKIKRSMEVLGVSKEDFNPDAFSIDGDFGPKTRAAVMLIQGRTSINDKGITLLEAESYGKGLTVDGVIGKDTIKVLDTLALESHSRESKRQFDAWKEEYLKGGSGRNEPKILSQEGGKIIIEDRGFLGTGLGKEYSQEANTKDNSFTKFGFSTKVSDGQVELNYKGKGK